MYSYILSKFFIYRSNFEIYINNYQEQGIFKMFSQFFEKKHLKLNHTLKSIPQNGFLEHHTPKSSLRNISKINCKSSQKLKSPFNSRSKSPVSPTLSKNFPNTPKTPTLSQQKPKESPKISGKKYNFFKKMKK